MPGRVDPGRGRYLPVGRATRVTAKTPSGVTRHRAPGVACSARRRGVPPAADPCRPVCLETYDRCVAVELEDHGVGIDDDTVGLEVAGDLQLRQLVRFRCDRDA